MYLVITY